MILRKTPTIKRSLQLHLLAVGKIVRGGQVALRINPRPANADDAAALEMEAVIDEVFSKPGLDYGAVNVDDAEEEASWAAFLVHAAEEDDRSDAYDAGYSDFVNLLPSVAHLYDNAAQQTAYANGYYEAQRGIWAADVPSAYADDSDDETWHARGGW